MIDSSIYIVEDSAIAENADGFGDKGTYKMELKITRDRMRFEGKWRNSSGGLFSSFSSKVWIEKPINPSMPLINNPVKEITSTRSTNMIKTIELDSTEHGPIQIEITDNAQVDNDVISTYINDTCIMHKKVISKTAITVNTQINRSQPLYIIKVVAESEGSEPPCTAFMSITTNKRTFTATLESDTTSSGAVRIILK